MIIKPAKQEHTPKLVELWLEFMDEHDKIIISENPGLKTLEVKDPKMGESYKEFLSLHLKSEDGTVFIAEEDGEIIGYTLIFIKDEIPIYKNKKIGYISDLYVTKRFRNQEISSKLKDKSLDWFKKKGIKFIAVPLYPDNKHAHSIYRKWGFFDYKVEMRKEI